MTPTILPLNQLHNGKCGSCTRNKLCFGRFLSDSNAAEQLDLEISNRILHRGDHIFYSGQEFTSLYMVRSGHVKTVMVTEDGEEQITGFPGPGDSIGADGLATGRYAVDAIALDTVSICTLHFDHLLRASAGEEKVQQLLLTMFSEMIFGNEQLLLTLGKLDAQQRMATFLLKQSHAQLRNGCSPVSFTLAMSRADIGNHLNLAVETVSRLLTQFKQRGLIKFNRNDIEWLDIDGLANLSNRREYTLPPMAEHLATAQLN
jgi:CRP/FNR family transcriptional regulator